MCGQNVYVVGLTVAGVNKSLNRWKACKQIGIEWGSYECHCSVGRKQVMLIEWPVTLTNLSWTLCDISEYCDGKIVTELIIERILIIDVI